ncbi:MAG: hypothetical protein ACRCYV_04470 [Aeromonas sp.]
MALTLQLNFIEHLTSFALTGCGGSSDDNGSNGSNGNSGALTATFIDSPVAGLDVTCDTRASKTDDKGQFKFNAGDTCAFKLGQTDLGATKMSETSGIVTPYSIATDDQQAIRIAALLQTMDENSNSSDGITLLETEIAGMLVDLSDDTKFETSLNQAVEDSGLNKKPVDLETAKEHMNDSLNAAHSRSVAVGQILEDLDIYATAHDWTTINFEDSFAEYKQLLAAEANSADAMNGKIDRDFMSAIIAVMEVTNDPIMAKLLEIETQSVIGSGYTDNLAKVLDLFANPNALASANIKAGYSSTELAPLYLKYAKQLQNAANALAQITDKDYAADYYGEGELLTYAMAHQIRATALAMASALNVAASYNYGSTDLYRVQQEQISVPTFTIKWNGMGNDIGDFGDSRQIDAQYMTGLSQPNRFVEDKNFFTLTSTAKENFANAKKLLQDAAAVLLGTQDQLSAEDKSQLTDLQKHLAGDTSVPFVSLQQKNFRETYLCFSPEPGSSDLGCSTTKAGHTGYTASYGVNLNQYFINGLSRADIDLTFRSQCGTRVRYNEMAKAGIYNQDLSNAFNKPTCEVNQQDIYAIYSSLDSYWDGPFEYIGHEENDSEYADVFAQAIPMDWSFSVSAKQGESFNKIFNSCSVIKKETIYNPSTNEIYDEIETKHSAQCDDLLNSVALGNSN